MKKIFLILILLFIPLNIKAEAKKCSYKESQVLNMGLAKEEATLTLYLECDETKCYITETEYSSNYFNVGKIAGIVGLQSDMSKVPLDGCPTKIGLTHPLSAGVPIMRINQCNHDEYGCFEPVVDEKDATFPPSSKYDGMTTCRDVDYDYIKECGCMPAALADLTSRIYMIIKIAAPALLLVIGGFDLIKAMSAQDESAINKARQKLVKKFVAATMVFLLFTLIQFVASAFSGGNTATLKCVDYLLNGYDNVV